MSESERRSRTFYDTLGAEGLAARTTAEWDRAIVDRVLAMLPPQADVLDVGCGYGRVAIPLAREGHRVEGIDISPVLIEAARKSADAERVAVDFQVGSMTSLPYAEDTFHGVICLWSAFHELLARGEQISALTEIRRVVTPEGFALIEGPRPDGPARVSEDVVEGLPNAHFRHDETSFRELCEEAGIHEFRIYEDDWAGRTRLFLRLEKSPP